MKLRVLKNIILIVVTGVNLFNLNAQELFIPVNKRTLANHQNQLKPIKLSISEIENESNVIYSEIHNPDFASSESFFLKVGMGEQSTGKYPAEFRNRESLQFTISVRENSSDNFQPLLSIPYSFIFKQNERRNQEIEKILMSQEFRISNFGDTLFFVTKGNYMIFPGISTANYMKVGETQNPIHSCGIGEIHNPTLTYGSVADKEGNIYKTIRIGTQEWMAENLKSSIFQSGDAIAELSKNKVWKKISQPGFCWFENKNDLECPNGKLYNGFVVSSKDNVCPVGWKIPSFQDWLSLFKTVGGTKSGLRLLKSSGINYYRQGDNSSGFSAIPSGIRARNGRFISGFNTGFWTSSPGVEKGAPKYRSVLLLTFDDFEDDSDPFQDLELNNGLSIRCIRDEKK